MHDSQNRHHNSMGHCSIVSSLQKRGCKAVTAQGISQSACNSRRGEVYLEGALERGIVPDESVWMQGGGAGEDGCLLLLRKMNLELLRQCGPAPLCITQCPAMSPGTESHDCFPFQSWPCAPVRPAAHGHGCY